MNNEKFTQGEWVVSEQKDEISVYMGDAVDSPYEYNCSDVWSCESYWSDDDETAIANAHLISAAPDMYRALRNINQAIIDSNNEIELADAVTALCHDISQVLAKADGEV